MRSVEDGPGNSKVTSDTFVTGQSAGAASSRCPIPAPRL